MSIATLGSLGLSSFSAAAPLALAALGALATESAGSLSIALEGYMIVGAFAAALSSQLGGLALGLAAGALAGMSFAALVGLASLAFRADVFVAALAVNIAAPGIVSMVSQSAFGTKGVLVADRLRTGPWPILAVLAACCALVAIALTQTVFGLRLRASGSQAGPETSKAAGIASARYKLAAHLISGAAAGVAGASLAAGVGAYVPGMSTGRGWIALVAVFLGGRRPLGTMLSCLLFGFLLALANLGQALWGGLLASGTVELLQALPYIATAVALVAWKRIERSKAEGA
jgi:Uncharacterized ABC-type transport system, permease component